MKTTNSMLTGSGAITRKLLDNLTSMFRHSLCYIIQVVAVGARKLDDAQRLTDKFNIPKAYGSYLELAKDPDVGKQCNVIVWRSLLCINLNNSGVYHWTRPFTQFLVADPEFPREKRRPQTGAPTYYLAKFLPKTAWKWKYFDREPYVPSSPWISPNITLTVSWQIKYKSLFPAKLN